jgi:hypothetical protein
MSGALQPNGAPHGMDETHYAGPPNVRSRCGQEGMVGWVNDAIGASNRAAGISGSMGSLHVSNFHAPVRHTASAILFLT